MENGKPILGYDLLTDPEWKKNLPPMTRRVIIDVEIDQAVKVYTESFTDGKRFVLSLESIVSQIPVTTIAESESVTRPW